MPDPQYALFKVSVSVLTPLHIGSGNELLNEYDYAIHKGQTWRINDAAWLEAQDVEDPALVEHLASTPPAQLLNDEDFTPGSPFFRYVIRGTPRSSASGAVVREQIKTSFDQPYLPGSSLKGALRTALGWMAWEQKGLRPSMGDLGFRRERAAQNYEHALFGPNPNRDSLRALQVSDSAPVDASKLLIVNVNVLGGSGRREPAIPVEMEAIRPDTIFELTLKLDLALFSDWATRAGLRLEGRDNLLQIPRVLQIFSRQRVEQELAWYAHHPEAERIASFYRQLSAARLNENQAVLQLGWGTGWDGVTFGSRLKTDPSFLQQIVKNYRLSRAPHPTAEFPKSRRGAVLFQKDPSGRLTTIPATPMGWVVLNFTPLAPIPEQWQRLAKPLAIATPAAQPQAVPTSPAPSAPSPVHLEAAPSAPTQSRPQAAPPPPKPPAAPIISEFTQLPIVGQRFRATVLSVESKGCFLELPGLDADSQAIGWLENPAARLREGATLICEVAALTPDPQQKGLTRVICRQ